MTSHKKPQINNKTKNPSITQKDEIELSLLILFCWLHNFYIGISDPMCHHFIWHYLDFELAWSLDLIAFLKIWHSKQFFFRTVAPSAVSSGNNEHHLILSSVFFTQTNLLSHLWMTKMRQSQNNETEHSIAKVQSMLHPLVARSVGLGRWQFITAMHDTAIKCNERLVKF